MKAITYILCILFFASCENTSTSIQPESEYHYVLNPPSTDTTCLKEIARAKLDSSYGIITFTLPMGLGSYEVRQIKYLRILCAKLNLEVRYELFGCIRTQGQTQGCYGDYMDFIIARKYGRNIRDSLLKVADSLLVASHDTVEYHLCDKRPQIPGHNDYETNVYVKLDSTLKAHLKSDEEGRFPFIDVGFYIDTSGHPSNYSLDFFMDADNESNRAWKNQLYEVAITKLMEIELWQPGEINGHKIPTHNNARVYFL